MNSASETQIYYFFFLLHFPYSWISWTVHMTYKKCKRMKKDAIQTHTTPVREFGYICKQIYNLSENADISFIFIFILFYYKWGSLVCGLIYHMSCNGKNNTKCILSEPWYNYYCSHNTHWKATGQSLEAPRYTTLSLSQCR